MTAAILVLECRNRHDAFNDTTKAENIVIKQIILVLVYQCPLNFSGDRTQCVNRQI